MQGYAGTHRERKSTGRGDGLGVLLLIREKKLIHGTSANNVLILRSLFPPFHLT